MINRFRLSVAHVSEVVLLIINYVFIEEIRLPVRRSVLPRELILRLLRREFFPRNLLFQVLALGHAIAIVVAFNVLTTALLVSPKNWLVGLPLHVLLIVLRNQVALFLV